MPAGSQGAHRDSQRARVYAAENQVARIIDASATFPTIELFGSGVVVPLDRKFGDLASVQSYVDAVLALNWVRSAWPRAALPITVRARRGTAKAHYEHASATIALPPFEMGGRWSLRELVVLHELAHHLTDETLVSHGPEFVGTLLTLVGELIGPEADFLLRTTLHENSVVVTGPSGPA